MNRQRSSWRGGSTLVILVLGVFALGGAVEAAGSEGLKRTTIAMFINMIVVVGLYTFSGLSGILSFGHIAFMGIGAYTYALVTIPASLKAGLLPDLPSLLAETTVSPTVAVLIGGGAAGVIATLLALPMMRLTGLSAVVATLAVLMIGQIVLSNLERFTLGKRTIIGIPLTTDLKDVVVWGAVAIAAAFAFQVSNAGRRLKASREDEVAARAIGISVAPERRIAFVLSAFIVGVAGGLYAGLLGAFGPETFFVLLTVITIAMLVVGGMFSLTGAVIGAVAVSALREFLRRIEQGLDFGAIEVRGPAGTPELGLAVLLLVILILRPSGISGGQEVQLPESALARLTLPLRRRLPSS